MAFEDPASQDRGLSPKPQQGVLSLLETDNSRGRNASVKWLEGRQRGIQLHTPTTWHSPEGQDSWLLAAASSIVLYPLERLFELKWKWTCPGIGSWDQHLCYTINRVNHPQIMVVWQNFSKLWYFYFFKLRFFSTFIFTFNTHFRLKAHFVIPEFSTFWFFPDSQVFLWPHWITEFSPMTYRKTLEVTTFAVKVMAVTATQTFCVVLLFSILKPFLSGQRWLISINGNIFTL